MWARATWHPGMKMNLNERERDRERERERERERRGCMRVRGEDLHRKL